jgi:hypothetical protein
MKRELRENPAKWSKHLRRAAKIRSRTNISGYTPAEKVAVRVMSGAKQRCSNQNDTGYADYGGRGIRFLFESVEQAGRWVVANLGAKPSPEHSIDRIDNDRHYEPGNLRWATRVEQARNKRQYRGSAYGFRMLRLCALRPDYSYEGLRKFVVLGWTDEQILAREKPKAGRPRK